MTLRAIPNISSPSMYPVARALSPRANDPDLPYSIVVITSKYENIELSERKRVPRATIITLITIVDLLDLSIWNRMMPPVLSIMKLLLPLLKMVGAEVWNSGLELA